VGRLTKHAKSAIASAAGELIKSWKATVTKEAAAKATADKPTVEVEVKEVEQEAAPAAAKVPTTPTATPSTGDAARDKLAVSLGEALAKVVEELGADVAGLADPSMVTSHRPSPLYVCLFVACGAHAAWPEQLERYTVCNKVDITGAPLCQQKRWSDVHRCGGPLFVFLPVRESGGDEAGLSRAGK